MEGTDASRVRTFAVAASEQLELLTSRTEALLFLARPAKGAMPGTDVSQTLRHLSALLVPAAKADGGSLVIEGTERPSATSASAPAVRLALAAGLLDLMRRKGGGRCRLETGPETVVRFSHESAGTCGLEPAIAEALASHRIDIQRSAPKGQGETEGDLLIVFPGS